MYDPPRECKGKVHAQGVQHIKVGDNTPYLRKFITHLLSDFQVPIFINSQPACFKCNPPARLTPAGFHLRNAEQPVASLTTQLRTIPLQQIMRGTPDASWGSERLQAVLARFFFSLN